MKILRISLWALGIIVFIIAILSFTDDNWDAPDSPAVTTLEKDLDAMTIWDQHRAEDIPKIAEGWSQPVYLVVSDHNWGDSVSISPDGNTFYFMDYPGDLLSESSGHTEPKNVFQYNADIYKSEKPFVTKIKDSRYYFDEDPWSAWGLMEDVDGNFFYASNRQGAEDKKYDGDIYRNDERLAFNTDEGHGNPHYHKAHDELWMSLEGDKEILVLRDAAANGFQGVPERAPAPLNVPDSKSSHPFLTQDGMTMYFSSNRDEQWKLAIYRSFRTETGWTEPEKIIWESGQSVGEPSLPLDESRLYYEQVYFDEELGYTTLFFYIEKE